MKNVTVVSKGERPQHMDWDLYEYSSDVTTFNLYEQSWTDIVAEGLAHLFNNNEAEFERKKLEHNQAEAYAEV